MGIRYFAKAVTPELIERARHDPLISVCCYPDDDLWGPERKELPTLDLDKAWRGIQDLLGASEFGVGQFGRRDFGPSQFGAGGLGARSFGLEPSSPRPAAELVRGYSNGMRAYRRLLTPEQVERAATDIGDFFRETGRRPGRSDLDDYIEQYLEDARAFATSLAGTGLAVFYIIG